PSPLLGTDVEREDSVRIALVRRQRALRRQRPVVHVPVIDPRRLPAHHPVPLDRAKLQMAHVEEVAPPGPRNKRAVLIIQLIEDRVPYDLDPLEKEARLHPLSDRGIEHRGVTVAATTRAELHLTVDRARRRRAVRIDEIRSRKNEVRRRAPSTNALAPALLELVDELVAVRAVDARLRVVVPQRLHVVRDASDDRSLPRRKRYQMVKTANRERVLRPVSMQHLVHVLLPAEPQRFGVLLEQIHELNPFGLTRSGIAVVRDDDAVLRKLVLVQAETVVERAPTVLGLTERALAVVRDLR